MSSIIFPKDVLKIIASKLESDKIKEKDAEITRFKNIIDKIEHTGVLDVITCDVGNCHNKALFFNRDGRIIPINCSYMSIDNDGRFLCDLHDTKPELEI